MLARATFLLGLLTLLLLPGSALAGGVGVFNGTGFHAGPALSEAGGTGTCDCAAEAAADADTAARLARCRLSKV